MSSTTKYDSTSLEEYFNALLRNEQKLPDFGQALDYLVPYLMNAQNENQVELTWKTLGLIIDRTPPREVILFGVEHFRLVTLKEESSYHSHDKDRAFNRWLQEASFFINCSFPALKKLDKPKQFSTFLTEVLQTFAFCFDSIVALERGTLGSDKLLLETLKSLYLLLAASPSNLRENVEALTLNFIYWICSSFSSTSQSWLYICSLDGKLRMAKLFRENSDLSKPVNTINRIGETIVEVCRLFDIDLAKEWVIRVSMNGNNTPNIKMEERFLQYWQENRGLVLLLQSLNFSEDRLMAYPMVLDPLYSLKYWILQWMNMVSEKLLLSEFVLDCLLVTLIKLCNLCDDSLFDGQLDVIFKELIRMGVCCLDADLRAATYRALLELVRVTIDEKVVNCIKELLLSSNSAEQFVATQLFKDWIIFSSSKSGVNGELKILRIYEEICPILFTFPSTILFPEELFSPRDFETLLQVFLLKKPELLLLNLSLLQYMIIRNPEMSAKVNPKKKFLIPLGDWLCYSKRLLSDVNERIHDENEREELCCQRNIIELMQQQCQRVMDLIKN